MSTKKGIGYCPLSDQIKIGRQNSKKQMWIGEAEDITSDFININLLWLKDGEAREVKKQGSEEVECLILKVKNDKNEMKEWGEFLIKEANK
jgi:hypothetical protein